jgi:hypothetical protein
MSSRTRASASVVASWGPVRGEAVIVAMAPSGDIAGRDTYVKSSSDLSAVAMRPAVAGSPLCGSSATSRNDPFVPAPKPCAIRS